MIRLHELLGTLSVLSAIGFSAEAVAQCRGGLIFEETIDGDLVLEGGACSIISSTINGDVRVIDSDYITLLNNEIEGKVRVARSLGQEGTGVANIIANTVVDGNFAVSHYAVANVIENETLFGSVRVHGNSKALVQKNIAAQNLICRQNDDLSAFVNFAREDVSCE